MSKQVEDVKVAPVLKTVQMYECSHCGKTNRKQEVIEKCWMKCDENKRRAEIERKKEENWQKIMSKPRQECETLDDIKKAMIKYAKDHFDADLHFDTFNFYASDVRTSHSRPFEYSGKLPDSLPGFEGTVEGTIKFEKGFVKRKGETYSYFSDVFSDASYRQGLQFIHTGTGGGGGHFRYDARIFVQDYPKMAVKYEEFKDLDGKFKALEAAKNAKIAADRNTSEKMMLKDEEYLDHSRRMENAVAAKKIAEKIIDQEDSLKTKRRNQLFVDATKASKIPEPKADFDLKEHDRLYKTFGSRRW